MSKSNMLLGLAKGKVGDLVFYRDGGEQRTRTRVIPKNPRTRAQMAQRVKIANVSALYRVLAPILSESFTNRPSNQSGYNAFASKAIALAPYLTRGMASVDAVLPQPCQLSKGILPSVKAEVSAADDGNGFVINVSNDITHASTLGALSQSLLDEFPFLQEGDKLTFVHVRFAATAVELGDVERYTPTLYVTELVIDSASTTVIGDTDFMIFEGLLSTNRLIGEWDDHTQMAAVIVSRVDENGTLQCSTEFAELSQHATALYDGYRTTASLNDAVQSYMVGSESILR